MITSGKHVQILKKFLPGGIKAVLKSTILNSRRLTSKFRVYPDFFIPGVMKGGTTSLYNYLIQHPDIAHSFEKEIEYYGHHEDNRSLNWYKSHFPTKWEVSGTNGTNEGRKLVGEATPHYVNNPEAPAKIFKQNPQAKIIILKRDPVERAYSHHFWGVKMGTYTNEERSFESRITQELVWLEENGLSFFSNKGAFKTLRANCPLLGPGLYKHYLPYWYETFPKEQILEIESSDFFGKTEETTKLACSFLGVDPEKLSISFKNFNPNTYPDYPEELKKRVEEFYRING